MTTLRVVTTGSAKLKLVLLESSGVAQYHDYTAGWTTEACILSFFHSVKSDNRVHLVFSPFDNGGFSRWVKRPEREPDHLPPSSALWSCTSSPLCICVAWCIPNVTLYRYNSTDLHRLTTGIRSEKCVVRRFRRCANVVECIYKTLDSIVYYTPRLYGLAYCS